MKELGTSELVLFATGAWLGISISKPLDQTLSAIADGGIWLAFPADSQKSSLVASKGLLLHDLANFHAILAPERASSRRTKSHDERL